MNMAMLRQLLDCLEVANRNPHHIEGDTQPWVSISHYDRDDEHGEILEVMVNAAGGIGERAEVYVSESGKLLKYDADNDRLVPGFLSWEVVTYPSVDPARFPDRVTRRLRCSMVKEAQDAA